MILPIAQIIIGVLLIVVVLLQSQGSGLSGAFGGGGELYRSRRSVEKLLMYATVVLSILFAITSILLLIPQA